MPASERGVGWELVGPREVGESKRLGFFFCDCPEFLTRLRLLITSVFNEMGRGRPWSFRNSPHALQRTDPASSRRQSGVVDVVQFWQIGGVDP